MISAISIHFQEILSKFSLAVGIVLPVLSYPKILIVESLIIT